MDTLTNGFCSFTGDYCYYRLIYLTNKMDISIAFDLRSGKIWEGWEPQKYCYPQACSVPHGQCRLLQLEADRGIFIENMRVTVTGGTLQIDNVDVILGVCFYRQILPYNSECLGGVGGWGGLSRGPSFIWLDMSQIKTSFLNEPPRWLASLLSSEKYSHAELWVLKAWITPHNIIGIL